MVAIFVIFTIVAFILVDALVQKSELKRQETTSGKKSPRKPPVEFACNGKVSPRRHLYGFWTYLAQP